MYFVRWYDPRRRAPLRRDFQTKAKRDAFLATLPFLYETGVYPRPHLAKRKPVTPPAPRPQITWGPPGLTRPST